MKSINPTDLFDLSSYQHSIIFDHCVFVWEVLGRIKGYLDTQSLGLINATVSPSAHLIHPEMISIGEGSVVEPGAYIKGPCVIGRNCTVRHGAYVRGDVLVGDGCVIGHDTEIKHSVMLDGAKAAHFAYVGDSILGNEVNLGAGTKCANLRFDGGDIAIEADGQRVATGLRKFGAILGDGTQIGCNAVTGPGTVTGKGVFCYPCVHFGGVVAAHVVVKPERDTTAQESMR